MATPITDTALTPPASGRRLALIASHAPSLIRFRGRLIQALLAQGHAVLCAAPDFDEAVEGELREWGAQTHSIPLSRTGLSPLADLRTLRALTRLFRQWRPCTVMGYTAKPAIYASLAASRTGVARIVPMITGLGYAFLEGGGLKRRLIRQIILRLYSRALAVSTGVIFHNADDAKVLKDASVVPASLPVTIVPGSGVDLAHFARAPLPPLQEGLTFLMIARLVRYKGVGEYCAAARLLRQRGVAARCVLVGPEEDGPAGFPRQHLHDFADCITYLGPSSDVRPHIAAAHVYVLPSYGEGMPRTVLEAMAMGRPIITTDARGCRETVVPGLNGYLVPAGDADALAAAMCRFAEEPEQIARMGEASRERAESQFDVARVNAIMLKALGVDSSKA
ncbi:MAG: glycosyltransferase family 4 protein [Methyloligellaceae bacterium]